MASTDNIAGTGVGQGGDIGCTPSNILTMSGFLKCVELVLSIIVMVCVTQDDVFLRHEGGGWVLFVTAAASLITIIMLVVYILNIIARVSWWCLAEFIYYSLFTLLYVTACITCGVASHQDLNNAAIDAAIFFGFFATLVYHIDTFLKYHNYRLVREQA